MHSLKVDVTQVLNTSQMISFIPSAWHFRRENMHLASGEGNTSNKAIVCFLFGMLFLSVFLYLYPLGEITNPLDEMLHNITYSSPMLIFSFVVIKELLKAKGVEK